MKAMVLRRFGKDEPLRLQEWPEPVLGATDVLVDIHAASVNPLDFKIRAGGAIRLALPYRAPLVLGNDFAGVVAAIGAKVTRFKPGDEVYGRPSKERSGTFAERIAIPEHELAHKPRTITLQEAAGLPLAGLTAWQALTEELRLKPKQRILIHAGAGGVGSLAIQLAKHLGAYVGTTASEPNHELVHSLGADFAVDYRKFPIEKVFEDYDCVLDTIGGDTLLRSFQTLKPGGGIVASVSGLPDRSYAKRTHQNALKTLLFTLAGRRFAKAAKARQAEYRFFFMHPSGEQLQHLAGLVDRGVLRPLVDRVYPLSEANEALAYVQTGRARGKVIVQVSSSSPQ
ncbi:NADP-dependent oxidoreductase [Paenibacillus chartarius]|uniref:NADP-dependent oxidoreductase n=1 Tax=Paenibacillus chartarius TaxID=747481 RepID=A0ABV6DGM1_9BACL